MWLTLLVEANKPSRLFARVPPVIILKLDGLDLDVARGAGVVIAPIAGRGLDHSDAPGQDREDPAADAGNEENEGGDVAEKARQDQKHGRQANQHGIEHGAARNGAGIDVAAQPGNDAEALLAQQQSAGNGRQDHQRQRRHQANGAPDHYEKRDLDQRQGEKTEGYQAGHGHVLSLAAGVERGKIATRPFVNWFRGKALPIYRNETARHERPLTVFVEA